MCASVREFGSRLYDHPLFEVRGYYRLLYLFSKS